MRHPSRQEKREHRYQLDQTRRAIKGEPPLMPRGEELRSQRAEFTPPPYSPERDVKRLNWPEDIPETVREWATLYTDGFSPEAIHAMLRTAQKPWTIRRELRKWGVEMRKPGGRNSKGLSLLARTADLQLRMEQVESELERIIRHLELDKTDVQCNTTA